MNISPKTTEARRAWMRKLNHRKKGKPAHNKGKPASDKSRAAMLLWATGEKNVNWKGDKVGYRALHRWVVVRLGQPHCCDHCLKTNLKHRQYHWANKSGQYKRDITDWIRLCVKCHKAYDKK